MDLDEALVTMWDAGLEEFEDVTDLVPTDRIGSVRRALGLTHYKDLQRVEFWQRSWTMGRDDTLARLETELGIKCSLNARVLPKGSIKKMRAHASTSSVVAEALPVESDHESTLEVRVGAAWTHKGRVEHLVR